MNYLARPISVVACQWSPDRPAEMAAWLCNQGADFTFLVREIYGPALEVHTIRGWVRPGPRDWVVFDGLEFDVCKQSVFEQKYESA